MPDSADRSPVEAIFHRDGNRFLPTPAAHGPWYPDSQHGSPMLGLLARAVEQHPSEHPMQVTRLTVDLTRAAPMSAVTTHTKLRRATRSIDWIEASLLADGEEFASAVGMRFRLKSIEILDPPDDDPEQPPRLPESSDGLGWMARDLDGDGIHSVVEIRPVPGFETPTAWFRLKVPLVADEETTPFQRAAFVSDMVYSVPFLRWMHVDKKVLFKRPFLAINPDTTINLHRPACSDWICLDTRANYDVSGAGTAVARVYDEQGLIGSMSQSLFLRDLSSAPRDWSKYVDP